MLALLFVVLAHPDTTELAAAAWQPVTKLPHDRGVRLSIVTPRVVEPRRQHKVMMIQRRKIYVVSSRIDLVERRRRGAASRMVSSTALEAHRIAGDRRVAPRSAVQERMQETRPIGVVKICVGPDGMVDSVHLLKSTGYAEYDRLLRSRAVDGGSARGWTTAPSSRSVEQP